MAVTPGRASDSLQAIDDGDYETVFQSDQSGAVGASNQGSTCRGFKVWASEQNLLVKVTGVNNADAFLLASGEAQEFIGDRITKVQLKAAVAGGKAKWTVTIG